MTDSGFHIYFLGLLIFSWTLYKADISRMDFLSYLENRKKCSILEKSTQFVCISSRGSWTKGTNFFTFRALLLYVVPKTFIELSLFQETTRPYSNKPPLSQKYPGSAPENYLLYQFYVLPNKTNFLWTTLDKFSRKVLLGKTWLNLGTILIKRLQTNSQN